LYALIVSTLVGVTDARLPVVSSSLSGCGVVDVVESIKAMEVDEVATSLVTGHIK
jgi:hypothetical protein